MSCGFVEGPRKAGTLTTNREFYEQTAKKHLNKFRNRNSHYGYCGRGND